VYCHMMYMHFLSLQYNVQPTAMAMFQLNARHKLGFATGLIGSCLTFSVSSMLKHYSLLRLYGLNQLHIPDLTRVSDTSARLLQIGIGLICYFL